MLNLYYHRNAHLLVMIKVINFQCLSLAVNKRVCSQSNCSAYWRNATTKYMLGSIKVVAYWAFANFNYKLDCHQCKTNDLLVFPSILYTDNLKSYWKSSIFRGFYPHNLIDGFYVDYHFCKSCICSFLPSFYNHR